METIAKEFFAPLEKTMRKNAIKYIVQKQMFCPITGAILDYRTCIEIEVVDSKGEHVSSSCVSPTVEDRLQAGVDNILKCFPEYKVKFNTLNKKLKNPLLTKL